MSEDVQGETPDRSGEMLGQEPAQVSPVEALARNVRATLVTWTVDMAKTSAAGRSATSVARMATARALSLLRRLSPPAGGSQDAQEPLAAEVAVYLKRAMAEVTHAAQEIERNRYSLQEMQTQLDRLEKRFLAMYPEKETAPDQPEEGASAVVSSGGDDRGADGEVGPSE